jgi:hypothetical protein
MQSYVRILSEVEGDEGDEKMENEKERGKEKLRWR